ncbi:MAG: MarR family transcriptional regulator [Thermomicrobiales bacterium]|nr:MarR family transcriptional regulator [Thermomicrobiales bacterium]
MKDSDHELYGLRSDIEGTVDQALKLLPILAKSLYAAISDLGHAYRLTTSQVKVLLQLGAREQMSVGEIAAALGISMPAASEMVDRLVEAGHLTRGVCPEDRRRVLVAATADSERIARQLRDVRRAQLRTALARLSPDEQRAFIPVLEALVAGLNETDLAALPSLPALSEDGEPRMANGPAPADCSPGDSGAARELRPSRSHERVHAARGPQR